MKFAIFALAMSGILIKYHYTINPSVTIYDMVFVRAFSQLVVAYFLAMKDKVDLLDIPDD